jgi:hypothetical protein
MLARLLRWLVLGVVSCLIGTILVIVVVGALKGTPKPEPVGAAGIYPSTTLSPDESGIGVNQAAVNGRAGHGFARPLGSNPTAGSTAAQGSGAAQASNPTQGGTPNQGSNAGQATQGSSPTGSGATNPGASPGASTPTPSVGNGATTPTTGPSGSQTSTAGSTGKLTYAASGPTGSSLVYLDPSVGEVQGALTVFTQSWSLTPGVQSEAAIVVTGAAPQSAVSCTISWQGQVVSTKNGTGRADCESVVPPRV